MTPSDRIKEIQERGRKATPGPWEVFKSSNRGKAIQVSVPLEAAINPGEYIATCMGTNRDSNAQLIAAVHQDIPWLLTQLELAHKREAVMRGALDSIRKRTTPGFGETTIWCGEVASEALAECDGLKEEVQQIVLKKLLREI